MIQVEERDFDFSKNASVDQFKTIAFKLERPFGIVDNDFSPNISKVYGRNWIHNEFKDRIYFLFGILGKDKT